MAAAELAVLTESFLGKVNPFAPGRENRHHSRIIALIERPMARHRGHPENARSGSIGRRCTFLALVSRLNSGNSRMLTIH